MHTVEWRLKEAAAMYYSRPDRCLREDIDEWKRALQQICSCSGWFMDIPEGFEAGLVKMVVNDLIKALDRVPLSVTKHPVGMDSPKNALIQKLNLNSMDEEVKVGIWVLAVSARLQSPRLCIIKIMLNLKLLPLYLMSAVTPLQQIPQALQICRNKFLII
ncbi:uncharacterized protein LOC131049200 isoform X2 [Cryptomeria japonica]|uniref:uncharacterized protein LOC131049200 isoform X2 n=1 Tax=Cryptomeria japonica TaxID=3369 RepID=UPI0025ABA91D|nr:uncharacterized protein LOC131049200 isoform X2 [Cryptomeria japonica]